MIVPISSIAVINRQRKQMDPAKVQELANDIQRVGLLHPPVIRPPHEGEDSGGRPYVLMVGGRRLAAHIFLKRDEIEVNLKSDLSPIDARIAELSENIVREDISWQEELAARSEIAALVRQKNPNIVHSEVAAAVGVSEGQLSKDLQLHRMLQSDPTLKDATSKGAAIRIAGFKTEIERRIENVKLTASSTLGDLQQKLFTADARDFIRTIPSKSIDLVFTDLPYGIDYNEVLAKPSAASTVSSYDDSAATTKDLILDLVPQFARVVKPSGWIVLFMCYEWHGWLMDLFRDTCLIHNDYRKDHGSLECLQAATYGSTNGPCTFIIPELPPWIWTRRGLGNNGHWPELHASNRYEMIVAVNGGAAKLARKPVENVLDFPPMSGERLHAMQKPQELCKALIERTTVLGERVLDVCMGSGAHMAAAAGLGRDFVGCDNNPDNLRSALTLVSQHYSKASAEAVQRGKLSLLKS